MISITNSDIEEIKNQSQCFSHIYQCSLRQFVNFNDHPKKSRKNLIFKNFIEYNLISLTHEYILLLLVIMQQMRKQLKIMEYDTYFLLIMNKSFRLNKKLQSLFLCTPAETLGERMKTNRRTRDKSQQVVGQAYSQTYNTRF